MDVTQSLYNPSLLSSLSSTVVLLILSDNSGSVKKEKDLLCKEKATTRFKSLVSQLPRIDFKNIDVIQDDGTIKLSQIAYADSMMIEDFNLEVRTKIE